MELIKETKVSIIMPAYNADKYIAESINSILNQTYTNWELIIVNDGSTDNTAQIISNFSDPRIMVFHQKNQGEAVARNHAVAKTTGHWLAFLDSDDLFENDFLEKTISFLTDHPQFDAVYTDGRYINSQGDLLESLSTHRRGPFTGDIFEMVVRASDVFGPPTCTVLNLENIKKLNLIFDSRIIIGPDWDFLTRFAEYNTFGYLDYSGVRYRVHDTNITVSTGTQKRRASLAVCRENQTKLSRFMQCSSSTKEYVFYDLLINLIFDQPQLQNRILTSPEFEQLTKNQQAKLFRLSAAKTLLYQPSLDINESWIKTSIKLNKRDLKTFGLFFLIKINPQFAKWILSKKAKNQNKQWGNTPFNLKP